MEDLKNDNIDYDTYLIETGLIGTPEYISPESLIDGESSPAVDLWSLGCILYLFFHGSTPFKDKTNKLIFNRIENIEYILNEDLNDDIKDLINKLLKKNPEDRIGYGSKENNLDYYSLKNHNFFKGIDWDNLSKINPPNINKKLYKHKIRNNSDDNLLIQEKGSIGSIHNKKVSVRKSNLKKLITEADLDLNIINDIKIQKDENDLNTLMIKDEMKNMYGEESKFENLCIDKECPKDISQEFETIVKKNEIRRSIKIQELMKDEVLFEG